MLIRYLLTVDIDVENIYCYIGVRLVATNSTKVAVAGVGVGGIGEELGLRLHLGLGSRQGWVVVWR